jgi:hypothetical protein
MRRDDKTALLEQQKDYMVELRLIHGHAEKGRRQHE